MTQSGQLVVISGPSGVGKTSIVKEVLRRLEGAEYSISLTTRPPRPGELDGRDYHFVSQQRFDEMRLTGGTAEWAEVHGHMYGTPADPIEKALAEGRTMVLDIDVQGGRSIHRKYPDAMFILIVPPDLEVLAQRLRGRGTEDLQTLANRLGAASKEIAAARRSGVYNHEVINDRLEEAVAQVVELIQAGKKESPKT
jgi:guanylate kinase